MNWTNRWILVVVLTTIFSTAKGQDKEIDSLYVKSLDLIDNNDYSSAKVELLKALNLNKKSDKVLKELAFCYYQTNKYNTAIEYSNKLIRQKTELSAEGYVTKCASLEALGKSTNALRYYKIGVAKYPSKHQLNYNYAQLCFSKGDYITAENYAIEAILTYNSDPESHFLLYQIANKQGLRVKALFAAIYYAHLEQDDKKSIEAYKLVRKLWWEIASIEGKNIMRLVDSNTDFDGFGAIEKLINQVNSSFPMNVTPQQEMAFLTQANDSLYKHINLLQDKHTNNFYWSFYGGFFARLQIVHYSQYSTFYMAQYCYKPEVMGEVAKNLVEFNNFSYWLEKELLRTKE